MYFVEHSHVSLPFVSIQGFSPHLLLANSDVMEILHVQEIIDICSLP